MDSSNNRKDAVNFSGQISPEDSNKLLNDPYYIISKRYSNNITLFMNDNDKGVSNKLAAAMLGMSVEEFDTHYDQIIKEIQKTILK